MQRLWLIKATIIIIVSMAIFSIATRYLNHKQLYLLGFVWLIGAVCVTAFSLAKEAKLEQKQALVDTGKIAQFIGFIGMAFGFYYANQHPNVFVGYGIFLASWLLMAYFLYVHLRKKGYSLWKRRQVNFDDDDHKKSDGGSK